MIPRTAKAFQGDIVWAGIALAVLTLGLHNSALRGWWRWDDPEALKLALQYSPWQYFFVPAIWQEFSTAHLMPWLTLSFGADLALFGLSPRAFYAHQLTLLFVATCFTYMLLRQWSNPLWSGLGAALFVTGAPVVVVAQELSTRHYIEGLGFSILALFLYLRALRGGGAIQSWSGGFFYALAVAAKEVYVPLVVLLPFMPEGDLRQRMRAALPYLLVILAYIPWRWYMLGTPLGGYGGHIELETVLSLPFHAMRAPLGRGALGTASGLLVLALLGVSLWQRRHMLPLVLVGAVSIIGPLVPVAAFIQHEVRYLFVAWWGLCCMIVLLGEHFSSWGNTGRLLRLGLFSVMMGAALAQGSRVKTTLLPVIHELEVQGRFLWDTDEAPVLMASPMLATGLGYARGILWMKQRATSHPPGASRVLVDEIELAEVDPSRTRVWAYSAQCQCVEEISGEVPRIVREWRARRMVRPLTVSLTYMENLISWRFGPYEKGAYSFVSEQWMGKLPLPASGQWRIIPPSSSSFYIRYDSPEGWMTYSSLLTFSPAQQRSLNWQR